MPCLQYDEQDDGGISLLIVLDPRQRGQGLGKRVLAALVAHVSGRYTHIEAQIENDTLASIACVESCGFVRQAEKPDDGFLLYRKPLGVGIS